MRFALSPRGGKPPRPTVKVKLPTVLPDLLSTSLLALKESADPFPPLKGVVGGVLALWDIAEVTSGVSSQWRNALT